MYLPVIRGLIDRRILVNFRVDPQVLEAVLPAPFRPQVVGGFGVAGVCLLRLKQIRPRMLPSWTGISSENAAHRIAVEWDLDGETQTGVFIPRRDTSSWLNSIAGGRGFPGVHHLADFEIDESEDCFRIAVRSRDGEMNLSVDCCVAEGLPGDSIFSSVSDVSQFFCTGSIGYSPRGRERIGFEGLEMRTGDWEMEPLAVSQVTSSFFDNRELFPSGAATFDNAVLMRGIEHEWHGRPMMGCVGISEQVVAS